MRRIKGTRERDRGRPAGTDPKCLHDSSRSCRRPDRVGGAPAGVRTPGCVWGALAPRLHDSLRTETSCRALVAAEHRRGVEQRGRGAAQTTCHSSANEGFLQFDLLCSDPSPGLPHDTPDITGTPLGGRQPQTRVSLSRASTTSPPPSCK